MSVDNDSHSEHEMQAGKMEQRPFLCDPGLCVAWPHLLGYVALEPSEEVSRTRIACASVAPVGQTRHP